MLLLASCASVDKYDSSSGNNDWNSVPKTYVHGLKAAKKGQSKEAVKLLLLTVEDFPRFAPAYINLGLQQLKLKEYQRAESSLKKSIDIKPENPIAYQHLGVIYRINGDFSNARNMYEKAINLDSEYALAHLNLGILLDIYLYDLQSALLHYEKYQGLKSKKDKRVSKWIIDIKRRIAKNKKS